RCSSGRANTTPNSPDPAPSRGAGAAGGGPVSQAASNRSRSIRVTTRPCTSATPAITSGARGTGRMLRSFATSRTSLAIRPNHSVIASKVMIGSSTSVSPVILPDLEHGEEVFQRIRRLGQLLGRGRHLLHGGRLLLGGRRGLLGAGGVVLRDLGDLLDCAHQAVGPLRLRLGEGRDRLDPFHARDH